MAVRFELPFEDACRYEPRQGAYRARHVQIELVAVCM